MSSRTAKSRRDQNDAPQEPSALDLLKRDDPTGVRVIRYLEKLRHLYLSWPRLCLACGKGYLPRESFSWFRRPTRCQDCRLERRKAKPTPLLIFEEVLRPGS